MRRSVPGGEGELERLLAGLRRDGVPLPAAAVLQAIRDPHWETTRSAHDWRAYVPPSVRQAWRSLPVAGRLCVFETAELVALAEDAGAAMVTGPAGITYDESGP